MPRATDPQVSFADWELMQQGMALDPLLAAISELLEEHQELIEQVRARSPARLETARTGPGRGDPATGLTLAGLDANQELAIS